MADNPPDLARPKNKRTMKKIIVRIFLVLVVLVVVALVAAFFSLNSLVKKGVETYGPKITGVDVRLDAAEISPFSGSGRLMKFFVGNPPGYKTASAFEVADAKLGVKIGSVLSDTIVVNEINIQSPEITLEGTLDGNNLSKILDNLKAYGGPKEKTTNAPAPAATGTPKKFIVKDIVLAGAKVHLNVSGFGKILDQTRYHPRHPPSKRRHGRQRRHRRRTGPADSGAGAHQRRQSGERRIAQEQQGRAEAAGTGHQGTQQGRSWASNLVPGLTNLLNIK